MTSSLRFGPPGGRESSRLPSVVPLTPPLSCGWSPCPPKATEAGIAALVIEIDRFGNVGLGLPFADSPPGEDGKAEFVVEVAGDGTPEWTARVVTTYGDLAAG